MYPHDVHALGAMVRSDQLRLVPRTMGDGSTIWGLQSFNQDAVNPATFWGGWIIEMGRTRPQEWR